MPLPENVPTVTVTLDRPRTLALTLGAMRRIKERTGRSLDALHELSEEARLDRLGDLVWAMLINEDREGLTPEDVEEMIHPGNMGAVADAFVALVVGEAPEGAEGNAVPAPPAVKAGKKRRPRR